MQKPGERLVEGVNATRSGSAVADKPKKLLATTKAAPAVVYPKQGVFLCLGI